MSTTVASNRLAANLSQIDAQILDSQHYFHAGRCTFNIVEQLFIGQAVGMLGNAATNVAFPLSTSCIALALLFGIGGAACFNLKMGAGEKEDAAMHSACLFHAGHQRRSLAAVSLIFLNPLLRLFGAPDNVMPMQKNMFALLLSDFRC